MKASTRKTIASASAIAIVLGLTALLRLWAVPQFGLNLKSQIIIYGAILVIVKTAYFMAAELHEESDGTSSAPNPASAPRSD